MERNKKALLIGLILGDGHLNPNSGTALEISHSYKQYDYIVYKAKLISKLLNCKEPKLYHRKDLYHDEYKLSKGHRYFRILYKWIYKNKVKTFSKHILSYLTPEAIALWWMDDGSHGIDRNKTTGRIRAHSFHLYTYTSLEDTENIIWLFSTYGIKMYKIAKVMKDGSIKYYLKCRTKEGRKLSNLLRPHILPSLQYKIMQENE